MRRTAGGAHASRRGVPAAALPVAAVSVTVTIAVLAAALSTSWLSHATKQLLGDVALVATSLLAAVMCAYAGVRAAGRMRVAWLLLSGTALAWTTGNAFWLYHHVTSEGTPFPSLADAGYLTAIPLAVGGLLCFSPGSRASADRIRLLVDAMVVAGSLLVASRILVLAPVYTAIVAGHQVEAAILLSYPVGDVVIATLTLVMISRTSPVHRLPLGLLATGFLVYALADSLYAFLKVHSLYVGGSPFDLGWVTGYLMVALAAYSATLAPPPTERQGPTPFASILGSLVVYAALLFALVAVVLVGRAPYPRPEVLVLGAIVLTLFGVRQVLVAQENAVLRRALEGTVAERTAQMERLSLQNERILEAVADGLYGVDVDGRIALVNPAAANLLGYDDQAMIGTSAHALFHVRQEDNSEATDSAEDCLVTRVLRTGVVVRHHDTVYRHRNGTTFPVEVTASPIIGDGHIRGAVVAFHDTSKRREVDRMKSEFVSVVSHELRTPLTSIRGSLGLLAGGALGALPEPAARMVHIALQSSERLTRLINDILDLERISSGAIPLDLADHSAADLVEQTITALRPMLDEAGVRLAVGPIDGFVHADADRVVQTLTNLLGNAAKFSPMDGTVSISCGPHDDNTLLFSVADEGRGIPADKLDTVFGRFQQVDSSDSREKGGTGLGLAICRTIVERHGGRIWAESEPGAGATFRFTLPATRVAPLASRTVPVDDRPVVLIVDDDRGILAMLSDLLGRQGFRTVTVSRPEEALRVAIVERPAVLVVDLRLPGMSGHELMAELRNHEATSQVPVVVLSVTPPADEPELAASVAGWVTRPNDGPAISAAVFDAVGVAPYAASVLVVEDDNDLSAVLVAILARDGLEVRRAATEAAAIAMIYQRLPEVLILDLGLPDGDGFGVIDVLRDASPTIPVIVYSASDLDAEARARLRLGPTQFLTKGKIPPEEVERRVVNVVGRLTGTADTQPVLVAGRGGRP